MNTVVALLEWKLLDLVAASSLSIYLVQCSWCHIIQSGLQYLRLYSGEGGGWPFGSSVCSSDEPSLLGWFCTCGAGRRAFAIHNSQCTVSLSHDGIENTAASKT